MAGGPGEDGRRRGPLAGVPPVPVCRRLQLVTVLLAIVGVLGLVTATLVALYPEGEGLGDILPTDDVDVMGQVRDVEGNLVPAARVTDVKGGSSNVTGRTGWYFLKEVDSGEVELKMEADGYKTVVKTVYLERGTYTVDFLAESGSGTLEVKGTAVPDAGDPGALTWLMVLGIVVASAFALLGAVGAHLHRWYPLVLMGGILGVVTWGWFVGSVLSIVVIVIALPLRDQFGPKDIGCEPPWHDEPPPDLDMPDEVAGAAAGERAIDVPVPRGKGSGPGDTGGMPPGR